MNEYYNQGTFEDFYFVKVPEWLVDAVHAGLITGAMLFTMVILYRWSNWATGIVQTCSAAGLVTWSRHAYSETTFSLSLRRLEKAGYISRKMVKGSHDSYSVTISNYESRKKVKNSEGNIVTIVAMINHRAIGTWKKSKRGGLPEGTPETPHDGYPDYSPDCCERTSPSSLKSENQGQSSSPSSLPPAADTDGREGGSGITQSSNKQQNQSDSGKESKSTDEPVITLGDEPESVLPPAPDPIVVSPQAEELAAQLSFEAKRKAPPDWAETFQIGLNSVPHPDLLKPMLTYALKDLGKGEPGDPDYWAGWRLKILSAKNPVEYFLTKVITNPNFSARFDRYHQRCKAHAEKTSAANAAAGNGKGLGPEDIDDELNDDKNDGKAVDEHGFSTRPPAAAGGVNFELDEE